jgi:hypothetical protein
MCVVAACSGSDAGTTASTTGPIASAPAPIDTADETAPVTDPPATAPATEPTEPAGPAYTSGDSSYLFDQEQLHTFEIDLDPDDLAVLDADPAAEEYVEGSLTFDGETIPGIGVRYKGSVGAFVGCTASANPLAAEGPKTCTKLSMKLKINWTDPDAEFYGVRHVLLHSQNLDSTMMHERLAYWMFREMGVPAPRSTHARVVVNGEYLGVFALTEDVDGRFTRENFENGSGNLYKEVWPFDGNGAARTVDDLLAGLETNEDDDPSVDGVIAFADELLAAAPDERVDVLGRWTDLDLLVTTFVVDRAIHNDDGPMHWYCFGTPCAPHNFYWYEDPEDGTLTLIPWDMDNAFDVLVPGSPVGSFIQVADPFGSITDDCAPFPFGSFGLLQRSAACDPLIGTAATLTDEFDAVRAALLAGPFSEARVREQVDAWTAQIEDSVAEAAESHDDAPSVADWHAAVDALLDGLDAARLTDGR